MSEKRFHIGSYAVIQSEGCKLAMSSRKCYDIWVERYGKEEMVCTCIGKADADQTFNYLIDLHKKIEDK